MPGKLRERHEINIEEARGEMYKHLLERSGWEVYGPFPTEADEDGVEIYMARTDPADGYHHEELEERLGAFATEIYQTADLTCLGGRADTYAVSVINRDWDGPAAWRAIVDRCDIIYSTHYANIGRFGDMVMNTLVAYGAELIGQQQA